MEAFQKTEKSRAYSEYYRRLRFYSEIDRKTDVLRSLEVDGEMITDLNRVEDLVTKKYKDMFDDYGVKNRYYKEGDKVIPITEEDIDFAFGFVKHDKAVSWDLIPGRSFKFLKKLKGSDLPKYNLVCKGIATMIAEMLEKKSFPTDVMVSRLMCLNKNASEVGKLENIRPIAIASTLLKLLEAVIYRHLASKVYDREGKYNGILNKNQIGFIRRAGCDLNIIKLRVKALEARRKGKDGAVSILFIDFKAAYDSLKHELLFSKMEKMGFSPEVINTIKVIYSFAKLRTGFGCQDINVNRGVLQGSLISPLLFNIYIDDLICDLSEVGYIVLAYADDLATINRDDLQLLRVVNVTERWSRANMVKINYKKSGIMYLGVCVTEVKVLFNFPVVEKYTYLGVTINFQLNCITHIHNVNGRVSAYLSRNRKLLFKFFSPRSLLKIHHYFQRSRLVYGLSAFVDLSECMDRLEKKLMTFVKSLFRLPRDTSNDRIRASLGIPEVRVYLAAQLLKNLIKYESILGERIEFYDVILGKFCGEELMNKVKSEGTFLNIRDVDKIVEKMVMDNIKSTGQKLNISISKYFITDYVKNTVYNSYDRKTIFILLFFCNTGYFRERWGGRCVLCNCGLSREHVTNVCMRFWVQRNSAEHKIGKFFNMNNMTLLEAFTKLFFNPDCVDLKYKNRIITIIRDFAVKVYWADREEILQGEKYVRSDERDDSDAIVNRRIHELKLEPSDNSKARSKSV